VVPRPLFDYSGFEYLMKIRSLYGKPWEVSMYKKLLISVFFMIASLQLDAAALDHLKKIEVGSGDHSVGVIDCVYLINLDQRPEKLATTLRQLEPYGIKPCRVSAVNGWDLSLEEINDIGVRFIPGMKGGFWGTRYLLGGDFMPYHEIIGNYGENYFCHCMARGAMGCFLSHLSAISHAYHSGYRICWFIEDDIEVIRNPALLSSLAEELTANVGWNNWDILYTDIDTKNQLGVYIPCRSFAQRPDFFPTNDATIQRNITYNLRRVGARYGTYSMIISRPGMEKILNFVKEHQIFLPIDMELSFPPGIKLFTVRDDVVSTITRAASDNGAPNFLLNPVQPNE
jgi:GR25 family glycosyltransferase involved in LPS biosynthesis